MSTCECKMCCPTKHHLPLALAKWEEMKAGKRVIASDHTLDALDEHFKNNDGPEADLYCGSVASLPNPKRVGVLDEYIVWLKTEDDASKYRRLVDHLLDMAYADLEVATNTKRPLAERDRLYEVALTLRLEIMRINDCVLDARM